MGEEGYRGGLKSESERVCVQARISMSACMRSCVCTLYQPCVGPFAAGSVRGLALSPGGGGGGGSGQDGVAAGAAGRLRGSGRSPGLCQPEGSCGRDQLQAPGKRIQVFAPTPFFIFLFPRMEPCLCTDSRHVFLFFWGGGGLSLLLLLFTFRVACAVRYGGRGLGSLQ